MSGLYPGATNLTHVLANALRDELRGLRGHERAAKYASIAYALSDLANYDPVLTSIALEKFSAHVFRAAVALTRLPKGSRK